MKAYVIRRLIHLVLVIWGALTAVFLLLQLSGDPVSLILPDLSTPEQRAAVRHELGLDQPLYLRYARFVARASTGDFGFSYRQERPVLHIVLERVPATLKLSILAVTVSTVAGLVLGALSAIWRGRWLDRLLIGFALLGQSVPTFWLAIILIVIFAVNLRLLPASGDASWQHYLLPGFTLGAFSLARTARLARSSMIEALAQDYVRTARAKGLGEWTVVVHHAVRNASIPVAAVTAFTFSTLIGGAIITEAIFAWPGLGSLIVDSVWNRDYPVVQGAVFLTAILVAVANFLTDAVYTLLDPRIKVR
jgi:peptide/nickel transport system permease protein